ncbi:MAG: pyruvate dehydrogenase (acetyl-transferring) E1 component subunit alpha [Myxococcales bacterium]|nr:MAG: pyruvate dehydrogenase (acetyl-transferring) E1 component subunit alpha [Myxococcales bacterium]
MLLIRRFEEEAARAYAQGKIGGFLHLYIGQEAIAVGADAALHKDDYVFQTYRDHGTAIARGMTARAAMAELYGKDTGCSRGLGGSMHFFDVENNFLGGYGVVGGHVAVAAGAAFKAKYRKEDRVAVCFFGEGATNIGGFHEGASLAGLWKLPLVLICENNTYAMGTPFHRTSPSDTITSKAAGYGMAHDRFEGGDVEEVQTRIAAAAARAREGGGPTLIEIMTYRFRGHSMSDPGKYRSREELEERKKHDSVHLYRERLLKVGVAENEIKALEKSVEDEVMDAVQFAEQSEPAKTETMYNSIYAP